MHPKGKRFKGKEMSVSIATKSSKFSALKGIAGTNKKRKKAGDPVHSDISREAGYRPRASIFGFS
jgi:hypothetical protein